MAVSKPLKKSGKICGNGGKTDKSAGSLSPEIKKMLTKRSSLVYFDYDRLEKTPAEASQVLITNSQEKKFNINIVSNSLDVYRSPFLIDLSRSKFIERISPTTADIAIGYHELPFGQVASKILFLNFWALENSEIWGWLRRAVWRLQLPRSRQLSLAPQLKPRPLAGQEKTIAIIKQIAIVSLALFLGIKIRQFGLFIYVQMLRLYLVLRDKWRELKDDEQEVPTEQSQKPFLAASKRPVLPLLTEEMPYMELYRRFKHKPKPEARPQESRLDASSFRLAFKNLALKPVLVFILIAFAIVLPVKAINYFNDVAKVKGQVMDTAQKGLRGLSGAQEQLQNFDIKEALESLSIANSDFITAQNQLSEIQSFLTFLAEVVPAKNTFKSGKNLLELGDNLSAAGGYLLSGTNGLTGQDDFSLTSKLKNFKVEAQAALDKLQEAQKNLDQINVKHLPEENRNKFDQLQAVLPTFSRSLEKVIGGTDFAVKIFGDNELKRYLLVFQNDNELRASGGFMGSFALLDLQDGKIKNIELPQGGTYDLRAGLKELIMPPQPLQTINSRWEFQDTNWWPDWPTSAENIKWFYNKSGGPTIDGVIAINSDWLGRLLEIIGPIAVPDSKLTIDAGNFEYELQKSIEISYEEKNKPKKILATIMPKILDGLFNSPPENIPDLAAALYEGLQQKDILMYFTNEEIQKFAAANNWDAGIRKTAAGVDYLSVVSTNIGGGKTDNVIKQKITHQAKIEADGSITVSLLISRYDYGPIDPYFTKQLNNSYLRIYAPAGSQLLKAIGFDPLPDQGNSRVTEDLKHLPALQEEALAEIDPLSQTRIYQEDGKTVFANWSVIGPGQNKDILLVYKLPYRVDFDSAPARRNFFQKLFTAAAEPEAGYQLVVQIQPGAEASDFTHEVVYPDGYQPLDAYPKNNLETYGNKVVFSDILKTDTVYYLGLKK